MFDFEIETSIFANNIYTIMPWLFCFVYCFVNENNIIYVLIILLKTVILGDLGHRVDKLKYSFHV